MDSRTVLVTGANRGLGLEFVRQYADDNWRVFAACRVPKSARELKELESRHASRIAVLALDVTDQESVNAAAGHLRGEPIDLLFNNAGVGSPPRQKIGSLDYAAWARVLDANRAAGFMIAVAESCTGGLVAAALTELPGSSEVFLGGVVTYANTAKTTIGVDPGIIETFGAVSLATGWRWPTAF